jgi:hypothetical protein
MSGTRIIHDVSSGAIQAVAIDDTWIQANRFERLALTVDQTQIQADEVDRAIVSAQLTGPLLAAGRAVPLAEARLVSLWVDGELVDLQLDAQGLGQVAVASVAPGEYEIAPVNIGGNSVIIEAV